MFETFEPNKKWMCPKRLLVKTLHKLWLYPQTTVRRPLGFGTGLCAMKERGGAQESVSIIVGLLSFCLCLW
jgi:hypothetical protein